MLQFLLLGYAGEDVESILQTFRLDFDVDKAQNGIVFIDEIDKIEESDNPSITRDVSVKEFNGFT